MYPGLDGTGLLFQQAAEVCPDNLETQVQALPNNESLDYRELADRLVGNLPQSGPFILLAESFSGPLALELAARQPPGLVAVVLVATFVVPPKRGGLTFLPWSFIFRFSPPIFIIRRYLVGSRASPEVLDILKTIPRLVAPEVMAFRIRLVSSVDSRNALRSCPVPILYLQASEDRLVPERSLLEILRVRPDVEHRQIDSPHFVMQICPKEAWKLLLAFLGTLQASGGSSCN
jgi:pimeloyl-ACP methyl ester carboxylesterase